MVVAVVVVVGGVDHIIAGDVSSGHRSVDGREVCTMDQ